AAPRSQDHHLRLEARDCLDSRNDGGAARVDRDRPRPRGGPRDAGDARSRRGEGRRVRGLGRVVVGVRRVEGAGVAMSDPRPAVDREAPDVGEGSQKSSELFASLDTVCSILRSVAAGQSPKLLEVTYPESHPVGALTLSVNAMMESLYETRRQSDEYSRDLSD